MAPTPESVVDVLREALQIEANGYHFYRLAASRTSDARGRQVFEELAEEERGHLHFLQNQYAAWLRAGQADLAVSLARPATPAAPGPVFSPALRARLNEAHFEMSALSIGIQLELASVQFYRAQAAQASDDSVRRFFGELADWESEHYAALRREQEALRADFWARGGFSPL